jgi:ribosomal protein S16
VNDRERYAHWLKTGATPTHTVRTLIERAPAPVAAPEPDAAAAS